MRKILLTITALIVLAGGAYGVRHMYLYGRESVPEELAISEVIESRSTPTATVVPSTATTVTPSTAPATSAAVPKEINLKVPFYSQAPLGDWSLPWQEACEEASVLLVANAYLNKNWSREEFRDEILKLVAWEREVFGKDEDTNIQETALMMKANFGLESIIHEDPTLLDIQRILSSGHLIIMPLAGKSLRNPYYSNGGPVYHMLVVKGYKEGEKLITHDVGTRQGENYVYTWDTINYALHDYARPIETGARKFIEVLPPSL